MTSEFFPLSAPAKVHHNTREAELTEEAIRRGEARKILVSLVQQARNQKQARL